MNDKELASEFYNQITSNDRDSVFKHLTDEQFLEIKKSFKNETSKRNDKRYYRYENALTNRIEWCIESRLGSYLKSVEFKKHLKSLSATQSSRNKHSEIYVYPKSAKKPFFNADQLELYFEQDPHGKATQAQTLKALGKRPTELAPLQY
ncbi:hypothetical protein VoSk93_39930 [Vibrio owensii]